MKCSHDVMHSSLYTCFLNHSFKDTTLFFNWVIRCCCCCWWVVGGWVGGWVGWRLFLFLFFLLLAAGLLRTLLWCFFHYLEPLQGQTFVNQTHRPTLPQTPSLKCSPKALPKAWSTRSSRSHHVNPSPVQSGAPHVFGQPQQLPKQYSIAPLPSPNISNATV